MSLATDLLPCPFVAGPKITDLRLFIGRREQLQALASRMNAVQPMSVNLVGERRIGKSSLLYAFMQVWDQYVPPETRRRDFVVAYLDLQEASPRSRSDYYRAVLNALRERPIWNRFPDLQRALLDCAPQDDAFRDFLHLCKAKDLLPVLCVDEFEALLRSPSEFDNNFFDLHRGFMDANELMYILASREKMDVYAREHRLTSRFFNVGHVLSLGELTEDEAADLARLPASTVPGAPAALSLAEQRLAREWGGRHPYLLQLAGYFLCQARQQGRDEAWAHEQFLAEKRRVPLRRTPLRLLKGFLRFLWDMPLYLGRLARGLKKNADDLKDRLIGLAMLLLIALVLLRVLNSADLLAWLKRLLEIQP